MKKNFILISDGNEGSSKGSIILNNFKIIGINYGYEEGIKKNIDIYMNEILKDINKYSIIEGKLDLQDNLLFNSSSEIKLEDIKLYINNKKVNISKQGKYYLFDINNLKRGKYEFKIYFSNLIENIYFLYCKSLY